LHFADQNLFELRRPRAEPSASRTVQLTWRDAAPTLIRLRLVVSSGVLAT